MVSTWLEEVRRNKLNIAELDESADLEAPRNAPGGRVDLDTALAQLPPAMRLCVVLAYNDGMSADLSVRREDDFSRHNPFR
jgi:DNA-directed RNA polymerase specialized sigma24 family protein